MLRYGGKSPLTLLLTRREMLTLILQQENKRASQSSHAQYQSTSTLLSSEFQVLAFFTLIKNCPRKIVFYCLIDALVPSKNLLMERA